MRTAAPRRCWARTRGRADVPSQPDARVAAAARRGSRLRRNAQVRRDARRDVEIWTVGRLRSVETRLLGRQVRPLVRPVQIAPAGAAARWVDVALAAGRLRAARPSGRRTRFATRGRHQRSTGARRRRNGASSGRDHRVDAGTVDRSSPRSTASSSLARRARGAPRSRASYLGQRRSPRARSSCKPRSTRSTNRSRRCWRRAPRRASECSRGPRSPGVGSRRAASTRPGWRYREEEAASARCSTREWRASAPSQRRTVCGSSTALCGSRRTRRAYRR